MDEFQVRPLMLNTEREAFATGVGEDLATLRESLDFFVSVIRSGEVFTETVMAQDIDASSALARVEAELSRLREVNERQGTNIQALYRQKRTAEKRVEAAEAECARLQQALDELIWAARYVVTMHPEHDDTVDRRSLSRLSDALAGQTSGSGSGAADPSVGERQGRQPDPEELTGLLVELSRWSRVAELNGDLHARIASALADGEAA